MEICLGEIVFIKSKRMRCRGIRCYYFLEKKYNQQVKCKKPADDSRFFKKEKSFIYSSSA